MSVKNNLPTEIPESTGFTVQQISLILWQGKKLIAILTTLSVLIGILYSLSLPNIYRAQTLLAPAEENNGGGLSAMAGQFGGLATLAGVNLGKGNIDKASMALEILKSRVFINQFITKRKIQPELLAAKSWSKGGLAYNEDIYDEKSNTWTDRITKNSNDQPTDWDLYNAFKSILIITQDKTTGLVSVSIDHVSPILSKEWLEALITDLNQHVRERDIEEAQSSVDFLLAQINKTPVADMQSMFYQLVEKQYQTILLANVREEYMFKVLDPAVIPQERNSPKRFLIVVFSFIFGIFFSSFIVFARQYDTNIT